MSQYDITYHPRTAIKGQAMADFIVEFTTNEGKEQSEIAKVTQRIIRNKLQSVNVAIGELKILQGPNPLIKRYRILAIFVSLIAHDTEKQRSTILRR